MELALGNEIRQIHTKERREGRREKETERVLCLDLALLNTGSNLDVIWFLLLLFISCMTSVIIFITNSLLPAPESLINLLLLK